MRNDDISIVNKELERVDQKRDRQRILEHIHGLADNPRPPGSLKLAGATDGYRIRVGDFRVLYAIDDVIVRVLVIRIGHRRDVYDLNGRGHR